MVIHCNTHAVIHDRKTYTVHVISKYIMCTTLNSFDLKQNVNLHIYTHVQLTLMRRCMTKINYSYCGHNILGIPT